MNLLGLSMYKKVISFALVFTMSCVAYAANEKKQEVTANDINIKKITTLVNMNTGLTVLNVKASPFPELAEVLTEQGVFYTSHDGKFFIQGKLYGLENGLINHSEESLAVARLDGVKQFENDMIVYPAKNEKHVITVFTDITCGYCRKMHAQIEEYNDLGITVRYLAYPRYGIADKQGLPSKGFNDLRSIWCSKDPVKALTTAKLNPSSVSSNVCDAPIAEQFNFGRQSGVNGTPALILENGYLLPGYRKPEELAQVLATM